MLCWQLKAYAGLTIDQAIAKYAPSNENDTASYAAGVRKQVGATATTTVAQAQAFNGTPGAANALRGIPGASSNLFGQALPQAPPAQPRATTGSRTRLVA